MAAELAVSMAVGPLVSLVKEKVSNYVLEQYNVMEGMEKQHKILKRKLPAILDIMADAEKQASHREGVRAWLEELKTVAYDADDVFDEFQYEALRRKAKKEGHITKLGMAGVKLFPTLNRVAFRKRMGNKLSSIVETIEVLVAEMNAFGFKHQLEAPARKEWRETDHNIDDPTNIVSRSRDKEREKIVQILVNGEANNNGDLMVVPIFGMGGMGKTTLAQLIYNDPQVQKHFQLLKWVCVSDDFDVYNLANKICDASEKSLEEALNKLQDKFKGKRYLLVLDDIWNKDAAKWEKLKASLKHGGVGSAVLMTTRDKGIAEFMGTIVDKSWTKKYHDVETLEDETIQNIIEARAFCSQESKQDELVKLVGPIAKRCVGSPLAAKALGSVLSNKTTKEEWEDVLQQTSICSDETGILPILKLSYDDLPSDMRRCFAFCAMYPKDYEIDMDSLIQLWIANGFISDQKKAEIVGERIVKEMVSRSFFQYVEKGTTSFEYSSITFLKIHDLMHDVAVSAAEKECFCITNESIQSNELLLGAARHIHSPKTSEKTVAILLRSMRKRSVPIKTLMFDNMDNISHTKCSSKHSSLRALSMQWLRHHGYHLPIKSKHLRHLRYLDLSHSGIKALPDDISILYNLQTLKLSYCTNLRRLPKNMKYMAALRHLYTGGCLRLECMPPELGRLSCLRTLTCFVVGSGSECSSLGDLKDLNIGGSLELTQLENVREVANAKAANLGSKKELRKLSLGWGRGGAEEEHQCDEVLEALKVHVGLLALEIYSYKGTSFPSWMGMLKNMVELRLSDCMEIKQLPPLGQLPELRLVHLEQLGKLKFLCSSCTSSTFGKLKDLKLHDLGDFGSFCQVVQGEVVAFPQLEVLSIERCENLRGLPEAAMLREQSYGGGGDYTMARSAFPRLKSLKMMDLRSFERWEATIEFNEVEHALFPSLETVGIFRCPQVTSLPRAPKLRELEVERVSREISLGAARCATALSTLHLNDVNVDVNKEKWDHMSSVTYMWLSTCDSLFLQSRALALWACFGRLQNLTIGCCHELVHWPVKELQSLVSLRILVIMYCSNLTGYAPPPDDQHQQATTTSEERSTTLLPRLESLQIYDCESLVEVLNAPAVKRMKIEKCGKLESLSCGKQQDKTSSSSLNRQGPSTDVVMASTAVVLQELSSPSSAARDNLLLLPSSLESLTIHTCHELSEVLNLPSSLKEIQILGCPKLRTLSAERLDALEELFFLHCKSLASLPTTSGSGPEAEAEAYSSLRHLIIYRCPGITMSLPSALPQRLDSLEEKSLDARHYQDISSLPITLRDRLHDFEYHQEKSSTLLSTKFGAAASTCFSSSAS